MADELDLLIESAVGAERDPYPRFAEMRRSNHVARETAFRGDAPIYTVYRHADIADVLRRQPEDFGSGIYAPAIGMVFGPSILQMDGKEHHDHRGLIAGAFRRTALRDWEESFIRPTVHELIDAFAARGSAELVREFTIRFPIRVIAAMLGIPPEHSALFTRLSIQVLAIAGDPAKGIEASRELGEYYRGYLEARRREPADDLISVLAHAEIDGQRLPEEELLGFLRLLLSAGAETTYRLLGNLLFALLTHPEQLDAVRADRILLPRAIEEALRWESPVQFISREALRMTRIGGVDVPARAHVSLAIGSANRDETVFAEPDRFDLWREGPAHLAFADGPHRCLGEHLARLETTVAMEAILDRLPGLRLVPGDADPHIQGWAFRSPGRLPVAFDGA